MRLILTALLLSTVPPQDGTLAVSGDVNARFVSIGDFLDSAPFPKPGLALIEVDPYGNILIPTVADAVVTDDGSGEPVIAGADIRGSRCARSVAAALDRTDGPVTIVCLPREYGLYERMNGRPAPGEPEEE